MAVWHVVSNEVGEVLGVYGSALLSQAQDLAKCVQIQTGCLTYLHHIECSWRARPFVGQTISMKNSAVANEN